MVADHADKQGCTIPVKEVSLSSPLRLLAYAMTKEMGRRLDGPDYEAFKLIHYPQFDKPGRQLMIDISERFLKPVYGPDIMAKLLLEDLKDFPGLVLIRDCGFQIEARTLAEAVGWDNFFLTQVDRLGCDFSNDSREWVSHEHQMSCQNNLGFDDLEIEAGRLYDRLVNQMGWVL